MEHVFCTVLSRLRVYQALALLWSREQVKVPQPFFILCVDEETLRLLKRMRLRGVVLLTLRDLNAREGDRLRRSRALNEYCWTMKPILIETLFYKYTEINRVTYIDADLFFYSDPTLIFENQSEASVLLTRGEIAIPLLSKSTSGTFQNMMGQYNSGFISFKRDQPGLACLEWWKKMCIESCLTVPKGGRFGDQKYLDEMTYLFGQVEAVRTPGVNIGHWNCYKHAFNIYDGHLYIDKYPLVIYHFSGYRIMRKDKVIQIYEADKARKPFFYNDYTDILKKFIEIVEELDPVFNGYSDSEDYFINE